MEPKGQRYRGDNIITAQLKEHIVTPVNEEGRKVNETSFV